MPQNIRQKRKDPGRLRAHPCAIPILRCLETGKSCLLCGGEGQLNQGEMSNTKMLWMRMARNALPCCATVSPAAEDCENERPRSCERLRRCPEARRAEFKKHGLHSPPRPVARIEDGEFYFCEWESQNDDGEKGDGSSAQATGNLREPASGKEQGVPAKSRNTHREIRSRISCTHASEARLS